MRRVPPAPRPPAAAGAAVAAAGAAAVAAGASVAADAAGAAAVAAGTGLVVAAGVPPQAARIGMISARSSANAELRRQETRRSRIQPSFRKQKNLCRLQLEVQGSYLDRP